MNWIEIRIEKRKIPNGYNRGKRFRKKAVTATKEIKSTFFSSFVMVPKKVNLTL